MRETRTKRPARKYRTVAEAVDALGWSDARLAAVVGVHRAQVGRWRRGETVPSRAAARRLVELGVDPAALL